MSEPTEAEIEQAARAVCRSLEIDEDDGWKLWAMPMLNGLEAAARVRANQTGGDDE